MLLQIIPVPMPMPMPIDPCASQTPTPPWVVVPIFVLLTLIGISCVALMWRLVGDTIVDYRSGDFADFLFPWRRRKRR